jgi:hypothetical protein
MLLAPTLVPLGLWAAFVRRRRPQWTALIAPVVVYGGVVLFQVYSYAVGSTFPFLRYYIAAIPFAACLAMLVVPDGVLATPKRRGKYAPLEQDTVVRSSSRWTYVAVAVVFAVCVPVSVWGMGKPKYAQQEYALGAVLVPDPDNVTERKAVERRIAANFSTERDIAHYLDRLNLPESSVIVDTIYGFAIVAASTKPKTFVVPSDPDFTALLNDPSNHGIKYLMAVPRTARGVADALNLRYPTLYETGADLATLELQIPNNGDSQPTWRLYRVNEPVPLPQG